MDTEIYYVIFQQAHLINRGAENTHAK